MKNSLKRALAILLVVMMIVGIAPMSAFAAEPVARAGLTDVTSNYQDVVGLNVVTDDQSNLAPGVTLNEVVAYDKNGDRVEMYVTTADTTVDTVEVYANYKDNQCSEWGLQTLSDQVAAIEKNYEEPFSVVAAINASYYNIATGKPTGAFVMEGVDVTTEAEGNAYAFFAVLKDGTYMIGAKGEYSAYKSQIKEAIGGYVHIVKDGAVVSGLDKTTKYPRQTLGLTADGKLILMTADGSQVPKTIGLTYQEQAEVMVAMGCVEAIHLDGGNSATFGGVREGTNEFVLINTPSGNVERAVSNTLCIVSTAVADGTFDHATISGEYDYFVPNSTYTFTAKGIDAAGGPANKIPDDVKWALSDDSFGTIADGKFVSNGKLGQVDVQMVQGEKVVGSTTISIVNPTSISFDADTKTIPYGKSSRLEIQAMYNLNEVYSTANDYTFVIANAKAGTLDGFYFTATKDETVKSTNVTATYKYATMDAISVSVTFGKGSEIIYDFEDSNINDWMGVDKVNDWITEENKKVDPVTGAQYDILYPNKTSNTPGSKSSTTFVATKENGGQVKNGKSSLGFTFNRKYDKDVGGWSYNYLFYTGETQVWRDVANGKNATKIGMWVYLPKEAAGLYGRICRTFTKDSSGKLYTNYDYLTINGTKFSEFKDIPESGWVYAEFDLTAYDYQSSLQYNPNENYAVNNGKGPDANQYPAFIQFFVNTYDMEAEDVTIYIDDITLDYSDVTEDRDAPVITNPLVSANIDNFVALNGQTVTNNYLSFSADVAEVTTKSNYTGLDYSKAKIYVDGMDMSGSNAFKCAGSTMTLTDVYLCDGQHEIVFEIADKQNNYTKLTKTLTVDGTANNAVVSVVGHNDLGAAPKAGSIYYIDVNTTDAAQVKNITTSLKLQTANEWQLDHIVTADGVEVEYTFDALNNTVILNITNNGATGETTLVSIPVRIWSWSEEDTGIAATTQWATTNTPIVKVQCDVEYGKVTFTDGVVDSNYICGFYSNVDVATEVDDKTQWHYHTATAMDDVAATCTETGYTSRTYCDVCKSVVDWGETVEAKGHTYEIGEDGILDCKECDFTYTGTYEGKEYKDGVVVAGWVGDSYYVNGEKLTGIQKVDDYYYDFGEDGVCAGQTKYTGLFADGDAYRYAKLGTLTSGWQLIDNEWYYFDSTTMAAVSGSLKLGSITYEFEENGKLVSGVWAKTLHGYRYYYGPDCYKTGWYEIDGKNYFFDDTYRLEGGWQLVYESQTYRNWYYFDENGVSDKTSKPEDGFYTDRNGYAYAKDGEGLGGIQRIDGKVYYFSHLGYAQKNGTYGGYIFKDDYAAYTGLHTVNNTLYYYENGKTGPCGLVKIEGDYYYSYWGGVIKTDGKYYVDTTYCDLPAGEYTFGKDGKMLNGVVNVDGTDYLYVDGKTATYGLYKVGDDYYYSNWGGKLRVDGRYWVDTTFCDLPIGNYTFGKDGKMLNGVVNIDGTDYLYINGTTATYGLYKVGDDYYYSNWGGKLRVDGRYWVDTTFCDLPKDRNYTFGKDGKMLDGIVEVDGTLYLYEDGTTSTCGLFKIDGDYYYAYWGGVIKTSGKYYVDTTFCDLPGGEYTFGKDGKMLNGPCEVDGELLFYVDGKTARNGLYEYKGAYYYSYWGGVLKTDGRYYVDTVYCDKPVGNYTFGKDGKMLDGIVEVDGKKYLYFDGTTATCGLFKIGDDYYYSYWGGELKTNGKYYAQTSFCDLPVDNYYFDADGKMLNGFVTKDDGIYYYENGKPGKMGLNYIDGNYYFIKNSDGLLVTNQTYYAWETNGLSIEMNYTFDEFGRVIL